jgi:Tfp pilus assembly protein PilF
MKCGASEASVQMEWGRALLKIDDLAKAKAHLEKAEDLADKDAGVHKDLALVYEKLGETKNAAIQYALAATLNTWDGEAAIKAALMYANLDDADKSLKWLNNAAAAKWIDTQYILDNFPDSIKQRPEFNNILSNMNPQYGMK